MPLPKYTKCDDTYSEDQPMLKITPEKLCQMPHLTDYECAGEPWENLQCEQFSMQQLQMYNCMTPGFNGRPVHFEYSPESGPDWKNARCVGDACGPCKQPMVL
jgi:hypothetical protein